MPTLTRALWHLNRTPLVHVVKAVVAASNPRVKARRRGAARALSTSSPAALLRQDGYARLDSEIDPVLLAAIGETAAQKLARADEAARHQTTTHKSFWVRMLDEDMIDGQLAADHPFVRFALQPSLLAFAANRTGELPLLDSVLLTLSQPSAEAFSFSQLWHRDYDDAPTLKVFTYFTDVTSREDGPFTFLPGRESDHVGFSLKSHLSDEEFFARAPRAAVIEMFGTRSTTFAIETSRCWHMGSRLAPGHRRLMLTLTYVTSPRIYPGSTPPFRDAGTLDERARMVLGLA